MSNYYKSRPSKYAYTGISFPDGASMREFLTAQGFKQDPNHGYSKQAPHRAGLVLASWFLATPKGGNGTTWHLTMATVERLEHVPEAYGR